MCIGKLFVRAFIFQERQSETGREREDDDYGFYVFLGFKRFQHQY